MFVVGLEVYYHINILLLILLLLSTIWAVTHTLVNPVLIKLFIIVDVKYPPFSGLKHVV